MRIRDRRAIDLAVLRVDHAEVANRRLRVTGWAAGTSSLELLRNGVVVPTTVTRLRRPDAAQALGIVEPPEGLGFQLSTDAIAGEWQLRASVVDGTENVHYDFMLRPDRQLRQPSSGTRLAVGALEAAAANPVTGMAVVVGWVLPPPGAKVLLERPDGTADLLESAYRFFRHDVNDLHGNSLGAAGTAAGFIVLVDDLRPADKLRLLVEDPVHTDVVSELEVAALPLDPVLAARWLFAIGSPGSDFASRVDAIDARVLEPLLAMQHRDLAQQRVRVRQLGVPPAEPRVSVIVPLYGRADFVEHQLLEFARDEWFVRHADLVYVVDDPRLADAFTQEADHLWRLYEVPFRWIDAGANHGFAGANNLGARHARAGTLLFVNSDVFPQTPGWVEGMLQHLQADPSIGALGVRLTRADGSIQHAGMEFVRRDDLGVWVNHHPRMGLPPALDPRQEPAQVPAVTGACVMVPREAFDAVGGWDTGYLVGDFEDSDLCLKLREAGLRTVYHPGLQLTHLERQSMPLVGAGDFRSRVVIYNALRHQRRWAPVLRQLEAVA